MRFVSVIRSLSLAGAAICAISASGASAQDFGAPFFGGSYAPGPSYAYGGYGGGGIGLGGGIGVAYNQGYYQGGYQYPAAGYGGGPYRRAAYSAADVYVNGGYAYDTSYERSYVVPQTSYRPYVRTHYVPVTTYRAYNTVHYQPVTTYRVVRKRCNCETVY
ncbi:hypothetical protein [Methylocystis parvus]|uniref:Uncharacterized protein n=1 Tax=Methylocystis parvus TaxID=134 RepID=A0A6B8M8A0_9HYPH|nr:hypothetical protein [Methylocystis parvus]QGM98806.1 hypothetical protein F7D14_15820 [Methylocystis parvus]WBK00844.1 hypothetical protein MMG94_03735 [Methylocystis parvus OBBP]